MEVNSNSVRYNVPRTAVLDGDIIAYAAAAWAQARSCDVLEMNDRLGATVEQWTRMAGADKTIVAISCNREDNFRRDFWPTYKAHRDDVVDPPFRKDAIQWLVDNTQTMSIPRLEADDLMGMLASRPVGEDNRVFVAVTIDKDLRQVPGWHLNPDKEDFPVYVDRVKADLFFHQQWMTGDATDHVPGMFRFGPVKAGKVLNDLSDWSPGAMTAAVLAAYAAHPGREVDGKTVKYDQDYILAQARCVRILRYGDYDKATKLPRLWMPQLPASQPDAPSAPPAEAQPKPKRERKAKAQPARAYDPPADATQAAKEPQVVPLVAPAFAACWAKMAQAARGA